MDAPRQKYLLSFDPAARVIEHGLAQLPPHLSAPINFSEYVMYVLEFLSEKIDYHDSTYATDYAAAYLKRHHVGEEFATAMTHYVLECVLNIVLGAFPALSYQQLSSARYVLEDPFTLAVYLPPEPPFNPGGELTLKRTFDIHAETSN